jgi:hypothetical protein
VSKIRHRAALLGLGLVAMLLTAGRRVSAFPEYPDALQSHFNQLCPVTCLLCHTSMSGGAGTIRDPRDTTGLPPERGAGTFVVNLIEVSGDSKIKITGRENPPTVAELIAAIETLKGPCGPSTELPCDADGDGKPDYAELAKGEDPERSGPGSGDCPKYGCGASHIAPLSPASDLDVSLVCSALALALLFVRRRG